MQETKKYIVVTETGGDVPADFVQRYGVEVVPMHVSFGGASYDDGSFPVSDIFNHYRTTGELPKTSGSTPQDFTVAFDRIHAEHPEAHIIYLAYSAVTTCSYESARIAGEGRDYITMIDTKSVSAGQFLVVTSVAQYIEDNPQTTPTDIENFANDLISRIRMSFIPGGLEFLRAGGRLSNGAYLGAQLLRIKPVIEIQDGRLVATKKMRGSMEKAAMGAVEDFLTREAMTTKRIALIRNEGLSTDIQDAVVARVREAGFSEVTWIETGCVISSHCGPGSFGIAAFAE